MLYISIQCDIIHHQDAHSYGSYLSTRVWFQFL